MTWVKICGITHHDDVELCAAAGVDALGFVVDYPADVPWNLTMDRAGVLMAHVPPGVQRVAVVGDDPGQVMSIAQTLRPDLVQLHADEHPATTAGLVAGLHALGVQVVKALRFDVASGALLTRHDFADTPVATARAYVDAGVDVLLVDSVSASRPAGTGRTVDLRVARAIRDEVGVPVVLAGGLRADNVAAAIRAVRPFGVDVISGVEQPVGRKDPTRVRGFLAAVRGETDAPGHAGTVAPAHCACIPYRDSIWYDRCMSTQIAVRLPDEMVDFLDRTVAAGKAPSRAALVAIAVEREMRRRAAETDAEILRARGAGDDLDALVAWTTSHVSIED